MIRISVLLSLSFAVYANRFRAKKLDIPRQGYADIRDVLSRALLPQGKYETEYWEGNESPFSDVLHHSRYNLEELMLPFRPLVPETLDMIRLEQAENGENHDEGEEAIIARALANVVPYSTRPEREREIFDAITALRYYGE